MMKNDKNYYQPSRRFMPVVVINDLVGWIQGNSPPTNL